MDILKEMLPSSIARKRRIESGLYPFFQALESTEGTEV